MELVIDRDSLTRGELDHSKSTKFERVRTCCHDVSEKKRLMIDLMHQVRTPLMSIQLNSCLIESDHKAIADYLSNDTKGTSLTASLATTIVDLKNAISQLDSFVTSTLQLEEILFKDDQMHFKTDRFCNEIIEPRIITQPVLCNFSEFFGSVKTLLQPSSACIEIEWILDPQFGQDSFLSYPDIFVQAIESIINNAIGSWEKASISIGFAPNIGAARGLSGEMEFLSSMKTDTQLPPHSFGSLNLMIRLACPVSNSQINRSSSSAAASSFSLSSMDMHIIERMVYDVGGDCRKITFDASTTTNLPCTMSTLECSHLVKPEQLFELHVPCSLLSVTMTSTGTAPNSRKVSTYTNNIAEQPLRPRLHSTNSFFDNTNYRTSKIHNTLYVDEIMPFHTPHKSYDHSEDVDATADPKSKTVEEEKVDAGKTLRDRSLGKGVIDSMHDLNMLVIDDLPLKVLVVDDSPIIYKVLKRWLESQGCEVTCAVNGKVALSYLQSQRFDITLMDFIMPVMLGRDAMKYFQEWKAASPKNNINDNMLLVGMSANASLRDQEEAFRYGMHFFSSKPVDLTFLSSVLSVKSQHKNKLSIVINLICDDTGYSHPPSTQTFPVIPTRRIRVNRRPTGNSVTFEYPLNNKEDLLLPTTTTTIVTATTPLPLPKSGRLHLLTNAMDSTTSIENDNNIKKLPLKNNVPQIKSNSSNSLMTRVWDSCYNALSQLSHNSHHGEFRRRDPASYDKTANVSHRFTGRVNPTTS